jgi:recombinational DNA repair protein (RecF pathway)
MQGFILSVKKAKNEDRIVSILSETEVSSYYRFYGARHSILKVGNLVNFEVEGEKGNFMPRLRRLSRIEFPWLNDAVRLALWQDFLEVLAPHLQNKESIETFYYHLLLKATKPWEKQNPKRILCEIYLALLKHEHRLPKENTCRICQIALQEEVALMQGFKPAHPACINSLALSKNKVFDFFHSQKTIFLEDNEVEYLFDILMKGL